MDGNVLKILGSDLVATFVPRDTQKNVITAGQTIKISAFEKATSKYYNTATQLFDLVSEPGTFITVPQIGATGEYSYTLVNGYTPGNRDYRVHVVATGIITRDYPSPEELRLPHSVERNAPIPDYKFVMIDATTGNPKDGFSITAARKLDAGATWDAMPGSGTIIDNGTGAYSIDIAAADTNGKTGIWRFTAPGAEALFITIVTETP